MTWNARGQINGPTAPDGSASGLRRPRRLEAGLVVGVLALLVGVATFVYPGGFIGNDSSGGTTPQPAPTTPSQPPGPVTSGGPAPATTTPPVGPAPSTGSRPLVSITAAAGGYLLTAGPPGELNSRTMACGSNQAGDKQRVVEWDLAGSWKQLQMTLTVAGQADPDTRTQVEVYSGDLQVYNNSQLAVGRSPVGVRAVISTSRTLQIRLTCESPSLAVILHNPTLSR